MNKPWTRLLIHLILLQLLLLTIGSSTFYSQEFQKQGITKELDFIDGLGNEVTSSIDHLCGLEEPENWRETGRFNPCTPRGGSIYPPSSFDWRDRDGVTAIKNQGSCGSCWAFATVGVLECNIKIKDGIEVDLSEQWLVSCNQDGWGCSGGWWAHSYFLDRTDSCGESGAVLEEDYPYVASDVYCSCPYDHYYYIRDWAYIGNRYDIPSVDAIKQAILDYGPVSVAIRTNSAFHSYDGGIFSSSASGQVNHAVVLIGWDDSQGTAGVWILKNSWGENWGEGGYMRIEYGCSSVGYAASYIKYGGPMLPPPPEPTIIEDIVAKGSQVISNITNIYPEGGAFFSWEIQVTGASYLAEFLGFGPILWKVFNGRVYRGISTQNSTYMYPGQTHQLQSDPIFGFGFITVNISVFIKDELIESKIEDGFLIGGRLFLHYPEE